MKWRALLLASSIIVGLSLVELCVRLTADLTSGLDLRRHPQIGWSNAPDARFVLHNQSGLVAVEINADGFRDVDHRLEKPPGKRRIVVIGDSFADAVQVNLYDTFFRRLQAKLGPGWEVINLGVGDFGSANEHEALAEIGLAYSPDVVIQEIFPLNDICNNSLELYGLCGSPNDRDRPYFVEKHGALELTFAQPLRNWLRRHSASYLVLERALTPSRNDDAHERWVRLTSAGMTIEPTLGSYATDRFQHPAIARAWRITEAILEKTAQLCKRNRVVYLPVLFPSDGEIADWQGVSAPYPALDADYPERRLRRWFERAGIRLLSLKPTMQAHANDVLPFVEGHFNAAGHRVAAEAIFDELRALGLVER